MLPKRAYLKIVRRPYPPFYSSLFFQGLSDPTHYQGLLKEPFVVKNVIISEYVWYYAQEEYEKAGELAFKNWRKPQRFQFAREELLRRERKFVTATRRDFPSFSATFERYMPSIPLVTALEVPVADAVRVRLARHVSSSQLEDLIGKLTMPLEDNFYKQEEYELATTNHMKRHVMKYEWLFSRYGELHPYTVSQAKGRRLRINRQTFFQQRVQEKVLIQKAIERAKKVLGGDAHLIDMMQFIIYYRTQRTDIVNKCIYLYAPALEKLAHTKGLTYPQILYCTRDEVSGRIPNIATINKRMNAHAMVMEEGIIRCVVGEECEKIREYMQEKHGNIQEFRGMIACKGSFIGTVRLVRGRADFMNVNEGDILVTSMTTPEMMPILKKVAAIVTDEGGITCHAAIISRELGIPCVIGTKIATEVLKDGDRVEVDAEKGVVRKVNT